MDFNAISLGLSLDVLIYIIRYSVNPNLEIEGLIFKFRDACIYTWVNVNLNFAE